METSRSKQRELELRLVPESHRYQEFGAKDQCGDITAWRESAFLVTATGVSMPVKTGGRAEGPGYNLSIVSVLRYCDADSHGQAGHQPV
jgi:hypothetical protein